VRKGLVAVVFCLGLTTVCFSQSKAETSETKGKAKEPTRPHLVPVQNTVVRSEIATTFGDPLQCDSDGNLYLNTDSSAVSAVRKISPKGERLAVYEAETSPDFRQIDVARYFAFRPGDDELYQLIFPHESADRYVFVYKSNGSFKSAIKLQPGFVWMPSSFAVFQSGDLLVTGLKYDRDPNNPMWPFTGIFSSDGSLLKELKLEDDQKLRDMAVAGDKRVSSPMNPSANHAIEFGEMEAGSDGNVYLMRWTSPAIFYAISAGGEVVRRFTVDPGDSKYQPVGMHVAGNRIATLFFERETKETILRIVDLEGRRIATYEQPRVDGKEKYGTIGIAFACYSQNPERFTFLMSDDDNHLQVVIAQAK
jgi:hypothetical protein